MVNRKRKYNYPINFLTKRGVLKKNRLKQIHKWRETIKMKELNDVLIENYNLKKTIVYYQNALEDWVLIAQNN